MHRRPRRPAAGEGQCCAVDDREATAAPARRRLAAAWQPHAVTLAPAKWIWLPAQRTLPNSFVLFRKEIELPAAPTRAEGWIAADSRYRLTVNGQRVQWGPAPCDPRNLDADPIDLKPYLRPGKNVIGVEVLFYGHGDGTWPGGKPGLIVNLDIETPGGEAAGRHRQELAGAAGPRASAGAIQALVSALAAGGVRCAAVSDGWDTAEFQPDARWVPAHEVGVSAGQGRRRCRADGHWSADSVDRTAPEVSSLRMRQIPPTRETVVAAKGLAHSGRVHWKRDPADWFDVRMPDSFAVDTAPVAVARGDGAWELPATPKPEEGVEATFEFAEQMAGFPRFSIDAPAGTIVELMTQEGHDPQKTRWLDTLSFLAGRASSAARATTSSRRSISSRSAGCNSTCATPRGR